MAKDEKAARRRLPVTQEIGDEGGSYADATSEVATDRGDIERVDEDGEDEERRSESTGGRTSDAVNPADEPK
jgi:hypothetical protein